MKVEGSVAVVTGASSGFGEAFSKLLMGRGGKVVLADVNVPAGLALESEMRKLHGEDSCVFLHCDVTNTSDIQCGIDLAMSRFGKLDIMVNNAGIANERMPELMISINLTAVIMGTIKAIDKMNKQKGGNGGLVVNLASAAGVNVVPMIPTYSATKHGVAAYTRCLKESCHLDKVGVRVNAIAPWFVKTAMTAPNAEGAVMKAHGFAEFDDVVKAFTMILDDETMHGEVITVLPENKVYAVPPAAPVGPVIEGFPCPCLF